MVASDRESETIQRSEVAAVHGSHETVTYGWVLAYDDLHGVRANHGQPGGMGGKPCIRDLRVTVTMVLGQLAGGRTIDQVLADYPYLEREDVLAALEYAAAVVDQRELPLARPA